MESTHRAFIGRSRACATIDLRSHLIMRMHCSNHCISPEGFTQTETEIETKGGVWGGYSGQLSQRHRHMIEVKEWRTICCASKLSLFLLSVAFSCCDSHLLGKKVIFSLGRDSPACPLPLRLGFIW